MAGGKSGAFSVTMKDGAKLAQKIGKLKEGGETAIKRTVSDFTSRAPGWISKGIRQHYGVDTAAIKGAGPSTKKGATHVHVAGIAVDAAALEYRGRTLTTTHFGQSPKAAPSGRQSKKIRVPGQAVKTDGGLSRGNDQPAEEVHSQGDDHQRKPRELCAGYVYCFIERRDATIPKERNSKNAGRSCSHALCSADDQRQSKGNDRATDQREHRKAL